ncbi:beclin-2-like [Cavia porcellus]|uniref:beclin-2-like n=1 Tax=Cavia porcellus TaxID=10141 RepID=UPI00022B7177|nr:beclin-2-like [Cavia porcellus]
MSTTCFLCQHCHQPLKLRQTLETQGCIQGAPGKMQGDSGSSEKLAACEGAQAVASSSLCEPDGRISQESAKSFTLLGSLIPVRTLDSTQKTCAYISDAISDPEAVDHPLCQECTDCLLEQLDKQLASTQSDIQTHRRFLEHGLPQGGDEDTLQAQLWDLMQEEARLARELGHLDRNQADIATQLSIAQAQTAKLVQQEAQSLKELRVLQWQQQELSDQLCSLGNQLMYAQHKMQQLRTYDIFTATFEITEDGPLGVINGFRLGRLPQVPVGWDEINAAWGQAALLLLALSKAEGLQFQRYLLVACGNRSYLKCLSGDCGDLPLASDGSHNVFLDNTFDRAMLAFLDCLRQFQQVAGRCGLRVPYRVHAQEGLLRDPAFPRERCSVRAHLNTEEQWTEALRRMLSNLKFCLAWASQRYRPKLHRASTKTLGGKMDQW